MSAGILAGIQFRGLLARESFYISASNERRQDAGFVGWKPTHLNAAQMAALLKTALPCA